MPSTRQPKVVRTAPRRIWLNIGDDRDCENHAFAEHSEVTWNGGDQSATTVAVEYVRADLAKIFDPPRAVASE